MDEQTPNITLLMLICQLIDTLNADELRQVDLRLMIRRATLTGKMHNAEKTEKLCPESI